MLTLTLATPDQVALFSSRGHESDADPNPDLNWNQVTLPASRGHESEADALGLQLVVRACRDPRKAIEAHQTLAA